MAPKTKLNMLTLLAKTRKEFGKKVSALRKKGVLPAVLYGPKIKEPFSLKVNLKEFEKIYQGAGESSLISLDIDGKASPVLIHEVKIDPITEKPIHIDFYQPRLDEKIEARVPLVFEGEAKAIRELGGTLVKNIQEVEVKALPQNLPHEIKVNVDKLKTFEDSVLIKDLIVDKEVEILKAADEVVALVTPLEKVEEELVKPVEEKVEEVKKVGEAALEEGEPRPEESGREKKEEKEK